MAAIMRVRDENGNVVDVPIIVAPQGPDGGGSGGGGSGGGTSGFSPVVEVSKSGKVTTLTIQDAEGEHSVNINDGADGVGVPSGGGAGQILVKKSEQDHDTEWQDAPESGTSEALVSDIDMSDWDNGNFTMTVDGVDLPGTVVFDSNNRPSRITFNGHTMTLTLPEVE